ncbi:MAG: thiamine phosphate synthase [Acidobacteriaceae bacterium]
MLLYAITQRSLFPGDENAHLNALIQLARRLAKDGVPYLQIREKDLPPARLKSLATAIVQITQAENNQMSVLLNGPAAIALKTGCQGIHLAGNVPAGEAHKARSLFAQAGRDCTISAACHSFEEVRSRAAIADFLLFSPVFEKAGPSGIVPGVGLDALSQAVTESQGRPVLALGGITATNAPACKAAGAQGIAAIRLFLDQQWKPLLHL